MPSIEESTAQSHFTDAERERLKLIAYYTLHASKSLTEITIPDDRDQSIWSEWVPELAFEHDFLLHGILGLSALHLALRNISRQKHTILAIHHYSLGVSLFRLQLSNITPDNYCAVFAFSCILAFYSFGIQRSSKTSHNPITRIHEVLTLMRGTSLLVKGDHDFQILSRWMALTLPGYLEGTFKFPQRAPAEVEEMLLKLLQRTSSEVEKDVYLAAIQGLRFNLCCAIEYRHQRQLTLTLFPAISPSEFWEMVGDGEFLAPAILANYAVILFWLRKNIWLEGWGKETVDAVRRALPTDWYDCIAWAVRETERENEDQDL